jgi:nitrosocyanin
MKVTWAFLSLLALVLIAGCTTASSEAPVEDVKEITVKLTNFRIAPSTIIVNQGDTVRLTVENLDGEHNLYIDGYGIRTDVAIDKNTQIIEFIADSAGDFVMWCEVRDHRDRGMKGQLFVN